MDRRSFIKHTGTSIAAITLSSHVPAASPSPGRRLNVALIGCGTQGLRELGALLAIPDIQVTAVCDPNRESTDYVDWSKDGLRQTIAGVIGKADWRAGRPGIPGGRDVAKEIVELFYASKRNAGTFSGCTAYADYRELLEKERDLDVVKVMTPDHLHGAVAIAAMKKGKSVLMHKPLANVLHEGRMVIETARKTNAATHFIPASRGQTGLAAKWIKQGLIGTLRQIHNWTNRPVWPQYAVIPADTPPVPDGFDWDLWLGPSQSRPYHPNYTHAVFRGWYEFGGGAIADMGHYSLWNIFHEFDLDAPVRVESTPSHVCTLREQVSLKIQNDYSFPMACTIRFHFAPKGQRPALDIFWYDGGIRPQTPQELLQDNAELPSEGMLFVGDDGKILAGFRGENPKIIPQHRADSLKLDSSVENVPERSWVEAFKGGPPTDGNFLLAGPITEAFNLAAISLRLGGKMLLWDSAAMNITNVPEANTYLKRQYRKGWEVAVS